MNSQQLRINRSCMLIISILFKLILCLISVFLLISCASPTATLKREFSLDKYKKVVYLKSPENTEDDPRNIYPQVVSRLKGLGFTVIAFNKANPIIGYQGSGFVVDTRGYIITSAHLFEKEKSATVWIKGKRFEATVIKADKDKDIALLKINESKNLDLQALLIEKSPEYKMGQEVYTIGFPLSNILGNSPRLNKGLISSTVGLKDNPDFLQVSVESQPGNSGSPLLDKNGHVIGLMEGTLSPMYILARTCGSLPQNVNFAVKANVINEFIDEIPRDMTLQTDCSKQIDFETVSESTVQVRSGNITDEFLRQPKMLCNVAYKSFWDLWYRFKVFHIAFYDFDTGELLLEAGQYGDNVLSTEAKVLDRTFEQIQDKFFPKLQK